MLFSEIEKLKDFDMLLWECINNAYTILIESFSESAKSVKDAVQFVRNGNFTMASSPRKSLLCNIPNFSDITISIVPSVVDPITKKLKSTSKTNNANSIILADDMLCFAIDEMNKQNVVRRINDYEIIRILMHEFAHIYEIKVRDQVKTNESDHSVKYQMQRNNKSNRNYNLTDRGHHNHKIETFPNSVAALSNIDSLDKNVNLKNIMNDEVVDHLNYSKRKKIKKDAGKYLMNGNSENV
jgi:hypothetical protein